ncbi:hypothetical protein PHAVU_010G132300 [Phaseolus vulgaris]|uniref:RING-type domain-containing protein n=1 Tax=Phaseolus vulgaris TaxID=3885 RepID=V7AQ63_PHAVU|nr:hypothetical protein PHAVU_010G132300g [Phaseolus vulgaris]ESW07465.1 hypothetical protein PHAVU_010G132300g [Phaseolus vulgaris]
MCSSIVVIELVVVVLIVIVNHIMTRLYANSHSITFHYKAAEGTNQTECVICLTSFEEEESVRKLHTCKHIFHTLCIDKWLGSHSGCPLCRTQIDKVNSQNSRVALEENDHMIMVIVNS